MVALWRPSIRRRTSSLCDASRLGHNPTVLPFFTREESREVDRAAMKELGVAGLGLMENAGRGATHAVCEAFGDRLGRFLANLASTRSSFLRTTWSRSGSTSDAKPEFWTPRWTPRPISRAIGFNQGQKRQIGFEASCDAGSVARCRFWWAILDSNQEPMD